MGEAQPISAVEMIKFSITDLNCILSFLKTTSKGFNGGGTILTRKMSFKHNPNGYNTVLFRVKCCFIFHSTVTDYD